MEPNLFFLVVFISSRCFIVEARYNFEGAIHASLLFYEAQRSGILPSTNRIPWRGNSFLKDGQDNGKDLSGGYFDAGDYVKFGFPMASSMTMLAWGAIDFVNGYNRAGELSNVRAAIKWGTDYFIKAHPTANELYGQVGRGEIDHKVWTRPEDWPTDQPRLSFKITTSAPGSDLAGETSAALASASILFKSTSPTYSATLLNHAKQLYDFANKYRGKYSDSIPYPKSNSTYYVSSSYGDELGWAAAWLYRATNESKYLDDAEKHYSDFSLGDSGGFGWDVKNGGVQVLLAQLTKKETYINNAKWNLNWNLDSAPKTPKGLLFLSEWGSLRSAADIAFLCLQAAKIGINADAYKAFALKQINYMLGDGGRSYVVGFGSNPPVKPHHRSSSCPNPPTVCNWDNAYWNTGPNPHVLTGALVGGPGKQDDYVDNRDDHLKNEVTLDYNAGFQSAVAGLLYFNF